MTRLWVRSGTSLKRHLSGYEGKKVGALQSQDVPFTNSGHYWCAGMLGALIASSTTLQGASMR